MKMAAFDIDGTILFPEGIAPDVLAALQEWQAAGHLAVAATGKSRSALDHALRPYGFRFDYDIIYTGAVVTGTPFRATLPVELVRRLIAMLIDVPGITVFATMLGERDALFTQLPAGTADSTILRDYTRMTLADITDAHDFVGLPLWVTEGDIHELAQRLAEQFPEVDVVTNQMFVDIVPKGASKGSGLINLMTHLGLDRSAVTLYTFGDSWNDMSMHAIADRSFAFPWSPAEVIDTADEVIESVAGALPQLR